MIGAAYSQSAGVVITGVYSVDVTPGSIIVEAQNGGYSSPQIRALPVNGVGPFDFTWTTTNPDTSLTNTGNSGTASNTTLQANGYSPDLIDGIVECKCVDTGNGNALTTTQIPFSIQFVNL